MLKQLIKSSKRKKLYKKYLFLMQKSHNLSTTNRVASDHMIYEAEKVLKAIEAIR